MGRNMLAAQDFSIRADISSGPLDLLTMSEHSMSNTMSSVQRRSVGHIGTQAGLQGRAHVLC